MAHHGDIGEPARDWVNERFIPQLNRRMEADGHLVSPYGELRKTAEGGREFFVEVFSPRYSHLYTALLNRPCLLIETHSLRCQDTRLGQLRHHGQLPSTSLPRRPRHCAPQCVMRTPSTLPRPAIATLHLCISPARPALSGHHLMYHSLKTATFPSEIAGTPVVGCTAEKNASKRSSTMASTRPRKRRNLGFIVPLQWKEIADELKLHGVQMEIIPKELNREFETWRFS